LQRVARALLWVVNAEMIEIQRNGTICWNGDCDPAACKSIMKDSSLLIRVISIAIRCTVFQLKAFMVVGH